MGGRWGAGGPPPEAYSRVTDPQRYAALDDVAAELVADLARRFDVEVTDEPVAEAWERAAVRLSPRAGSGADLVVVRARSGVRLRAGRWAGQTFPSCGCDACDEEVQDVEDELREYVADVVAGRLEEELRGRVLSVRRPASSGSESLTRARARELGPPGRVAWAPWPERPGG